MMLSSRYDDVADRSVDVDDSADDEGEENSLDVVPANDEDGGQGRGHDGDCDCGGYNDSGCGV